MKSTKISAAIFALFIAGSALAEVAQVSPVRASGGMAREFKNFSLPPTSDPTLLSTALALTSDQRQIADMAREIFDRNPALSIMLVDRGQIIFESYKGPAGRDTAQFSWSMSKSLVAYTIGGMLCDGKISSLDDQAKKYAPELEGTVYGESSIRNLLTMSSGARAAVSNGVAYPGQWEDHRNGAVGTLEVLRKYGSADINAGKEFRYLGNDTLALGLIIESRGGFQENFQKYLWNPSKPSATGYWLLGKKDNVPMAMAGVSAITADWARMAMFTITAKKSDSSCIRDYMTTATSQQIENKTKRTGRAFNGYGYQTWTSPSFGNGKSYWWVGYGGQRVGIDSDKERILVVTSHREDYMADVYQLFAKFQQY